MWEEMYEVARAIIPSLTALAQFDGHRVTSSVQHSRLALKIALRCAAALVPAGDAGAPLMVCAANIGVICTCRPHYLCWACVRGAHSASVKHTGCSGMVSHMSFVRGSNAPSSRNPFCTAATGTALADRRDILARVRRARSCSLVLP